MRTSCERRCKRSTNPNRRPAWSKNRDVRFDKNGYHGYHRRVRKHISATQPELWGDQPPLTPLTMWSPILLSMLRR
jgi:hypothetical protein